MRDRSRRAAAVDAGAPDRPVPRASATATRRAQAVGAALALLAAWGVFLYSAATIRTPPAWQTFEFCQYAEIGRNLAQEGRYETRLIEPMALAYLDARGVRPVAGRWPVVDRYPLPALVVGALMRLFGTTDFVAACANALALSLWIASATWLAIGWQGRGWGALVAALLVFNPALMGQFALMGTPDAWFALLLLWQVVALVRLCESRVGETKWSVLFGLLGGLAYLARHNANLFFGVQLAWLLARGRWRAAALALAVAAITISPLWLYNFRWLGEPTVGIYSSWNLLAEVGAYDGEPWHYYDAPNLRDALAEHAGGIARKWWFYLTSVVPIGVWYLWHGWAVMPLAVVGAGAERPRAARTRWLLWMAGLFVLQIVVFSALRLEFSRQPTPHHGRYLFWFAAPAVLLAVEGARYLGATLAWWIDRARKQTDALRRAKARGAATVSPSPDRRAMLAGAVGLALLVAQGAIYFRAWRQEREANRGVGETRLGNDTLHQQLARAVPADAVVAAAEPQVIAWRVGRTTVLLPANPEELAKLNAASATPIDYLFLWVSYLPNGDWPLGLADGWVSVVWPDPQFGSAWERLLREQYEYALDPETTRPDRFVLLRRKGAAVAAVEAP